MLERCPTPVDLDATWNATKCQVQLPDGLRSNFFHETGATPLYGGNTRNHHRYYSRAKAVLLRHGTSYGCFTLDISRQGIGFLSPVQLLAGESILLLVPQGYRLALKTVRCARRREFCYECGAIFNVRDS